MPGAIERGRAAFERQEWAAAHSLLVGAVEIDDLERLAVAAYLVGRDAESAGAWERAHLACVERGAADRGARCAAWLGFAYLLRGEVAHAGGWLARAERLIEEAGRDCAARGVVLVTTFLQALDDGDAVQAAEIAAEIVDIGRRFADDDVLAFGVLTSGEAALAAGDVARGMRLFDEVMVAITAGRVSPVTRGIVYCAVIEGCIHAFDLRRAAEWTEALHAWCAAQPDLVPYRGQCLVHRSQVLQAKGAWREATSELERARHWLSEPAHPALGLAMYQQGELHRLRGDLDAAEGAYRMASQLGREPVPGLALLRLAEGNVVAAVAAVRRMLEESRGTLERPALLAAAIDVLLADGDVDAARAVSEELRAVAAGCGASLLQAMAAHGHGSVLQRDGASAAALAALRVAAVGWRSLQMPYEEARARVQIALACRDLGDSDAAQLELEAATDVFERLGARPDLDRARLLMGAGGASTVAALTGRECEVLRLVASGRTNRAIALELVISEHTVARHLQNIFLKVGVSTRSAATAYAYEHGLVGPARGAN